MKAGDAGPGVEGSSLLGQAAGNGQARPPHKLRPGLVSLPGPCLAHMRSQSHPTKALGFYHTAIGTNKAVYQDRAALLGSSPGLLTV